MPTQTALHAAPFSVRHALVDLAHNSLGRAGRSGRHRPKLTSALLLTPTG